MNLKSSFKTQITCLFAGTLLLLAGCNLLKTNVDNVELSKFRAKNQAQLDSLLRSATRSAALGFADTAQLISVVIGLLSLFLFF